MTSRSALSIAAALAALGCLGACGRASKSEAPTASVSNPTPTPTAEPEKAAKPATPATLQKAVGRWLREDGGYVLEVLGGEPGGTLRVAYFNPNPITVGRAAWLETSGGLQLLVELTGSGYNGSTYVLRYDPAADRLAGEYRQAVQRQTYQIEFVRQTAPLAR